MTDIKSRKRTKFIPTVTVSASTFTVVDEETGEEYYPHAGEWVKFKQSLELGTLRKLTDIRNQQKQAESNRGNGDDEAVDLDQGVTLIEQLLRVVYGQIVDWNLTSNVIDEKATAEALAKDINSETQYVLLPRPSRDREEAFEAMWTFDTLFLNWLQDNMMSGAVVPNT